MRPLWVDGAYVQNGDRRGFRGSGELATDLAGVRVELNLKKSPTLAFLRSQQLWTGATDPMEAPDTVYMVSSDSHSR